MANNLSLEDFVILWSQAVGGNSTPSVAKKYLEGFHKLLLEELKLNGEMHINGIGKFYLREYGGYDALCGDPINGGVVRRFINTKFNLDFKPSAVIKREINEGEFEREKPKPRHNKKYKTNVERREAHNTGRRKQKPSLEELECDAINEAMKKKEKRNGKTQIREEDGC